MENNKKRQKNDKNSHHTIYVITKAALSLALLLHCQVSFLVILIPGTIAILIFR